jgi:hypothetical protein
MRFRARARRLDCHRSLLRIVGDNEGSGCESGLSASEVGRIGFIPIAAFDIEVESGVFDRNV